jgi:hypothetical protein
MALSDHAVGESGTGPGIEGLPELAADAGRVGVDELGGWNPDAPSGSALLEPFGDPDRHLLQEMGREVNTLGSKSNDIAIGQDVIELKSELAKLREQAQNVE